jgi:peptide/nickel transport system ATP-binding protein
MTEDEYEAEQAVTGDLSQLDVTSTSFRLEAQAGHSGADVAALLDRVRADDPAEPFWRGVRSITASAGHVDVELKEPYAPRLLPVDGVEVECNLYDEDALGRAGTPAASES